MTFPVSPYIEMCDGAVRIPGTRVSLDSIVACFQQGESPEQIADSFPTVTLAQVYGAIAYYLENQKLIVDHIAEVEREFERLVPPLSESNPELFARLMAAREHAGSKRKCLSAFSRMRIAGLASYKAYALVSLPSTFWM